MTNNDFDSEFFERRLLALKDSQDSIQSLSAWCLEKRQHHKKIVATWLQVLKKGNSCFFLLLTCYVLHFILRSAGTEF